MAEKVKVYLRNTVGQGGEYYGPGVCEVSRSFAESVAAAQGRDVADLEADAKAVEAGEDLEAPQPRYAAKQADAKAVEAGEDLEAPQPRYAAKQADAKAVEAGEDLEAPQPRYAAKQAAPAPVADSSADGETDKDTDKANETEGDELPQDFPAHAQLTEGGYATLSDVRAASDEELLEVSGIGKVLLQRIREAQG